MVGRWAMTGSRMEEEGHFPGGEGKGDNRYVLCLPVCLCLCLCIHV